MNQENISWRPAIHLMALLILCGCTRGPFSIKSEDFAASPVCDGEAVMELRMAGGRLEVKSRGEVKAFMRQTGFPSAWCHGFRHVWIGTANRGGYAFESSFGDPLRFVVDRDKGYYYEQGSGSVTTPEGRAVTLGSGPGVLGPIARRPPDKWESSGTQAQPAESPELDAEKTPAPGAADLVAMPEQPPIEPAPKRARPLLVAGDVKRPVSVFSPGPRYTEIARKARIQGTVILQATISRTGDVVDVKLLKGLPMGLDAAAVDALRLWKFEPATLHGEPVDVFYNLTINFSLEE